MKYQLHDIEITTIGDPRTFNCAHVVGEGLIVKAENISFKPGTSQFSHYALASLTPYIAAKQRCRDEADWIFFEVEIRCPDPRCGASFVLKRVSTETYSYH